VTGEVEQRLRSRARELLSGEVDLVVGYGLSPGGDEVRPAFIRRSEDAERLVWNRRCVHCLPAYLNKEACREVLGRGGRMAMVVKGCDARAVRVLLQEGQIDRRSIHLLGVVCEGCSVEGPPPARCRACRWKTPPVYDDLFGDGERREEMGTEEDLSAVVRMGPAERREFWTGHLSRCIRCYACRQVCPMCYCEECIADKSRPRWIGRSPTLRGNLAFHSIRAFHLAGRCTGCGECGRACPMGIPVDLISRFLTLRVEEAFDYVPGLDDREPFFVEHTERDPEEYVR
jgi:ferredoxin